MYDVGRGWILRYAAREKLGIKNAARVFLIPPDVHLVNAIDDETDLIHMFTTRRRDAALR